MCGIFAYIGTNLSGQKKVIEGLRDLEYRGYDSWGITVKDGDSWYIKKQVGKISDFKGKNIPKSNFGFGHTRWATHGGVVKKNAHPHVDCRGRIALIHNGIIENYQVLKKSLVAQGHTFVSDTDSEVAVHLIEEYVKTMPFEQAVIETFKSLMGLSAIIAADIKTEQFVGIKNGSPLVVGVGLDGLYYASDASALAQHVNKIYAQGDNEAVLMTRTGYRVVDIFTGRSKKVKLIPFNFKNKGHSKGEHEHFMHKEMHEQPSVINKISESEGNLKSVAKFIHKGKKIISVGCGTAGHAAFASSCVFADIAGLEVDWCYASESRSKFTLIDKDTVILAFSQSGETMDTIVAVKNAIKKKAKIIAFTNNQNSTLNRLADASIPLMAGTEKAVASTKAFTAKLAYIFKIAGHLSKADIDLSKASKALSQSLERSHEEKVKNIVKSIGNAPTLFVIGRGISYVASLETALKIKEVSYIHAEGIAAGELKHGVIALIKKGTPCIVIAPKDDYLSDNISSAMELKARGGVIIGISPNDHEVFDFHLPVVDLGDETVFQNILIGQQIAYYCALARGLDPDKPRNLAKSVTVK